MLSTLGNIPPTLKKNIFQLQRVKDLNECSSFNSSFKSFTSLLMFFLVDLYTDKSRVLNCLPLLCFFLMCLLRPIGSSSMSSWVLPLINIYIYSYTYGYVYQHIYIYVEELSPLDQLLP